MTIDAKGQMATLAAPGMAAVPGRGYGGAFHSVWGMSPGGGFFGWLVVLLGFVLALAVVFGVVRWVVGSRNSGAPPSPTQRKTPLEILEERLARGEIGKEEFEEKRTLLSK